MMTHIMQFHWWQCLINWPEIQVCIVNLAVNWFGDFFIAGILSGYIRMLSSFKLLQLSSFVSTADGPIHSCIRINHAWPWSVLLDQYIKPLQWSALKSTAICAAALGLPKLLIGIEWTWELKIYTIIWNRKGQRRKSIRPQVLTKTD